MTATPAAPHLDPDECANWTTAGCACQIRRESAPQSRQQIADALEYQLGDDELPGVWRLNAQDVRTIITALRSDIAPTRDDVLEEAAKCCDLERSLWKSSKDIEPDDVSGGKSAAFNCAFAIRALKTQRTESAAPREAHSMSEYRRVTAQGGEILPPQRAEGVAPRDSEK